MRWTIENPEEVAKLPPGDYPATIVSASFEEIVVRYDPNRTDEGLIKFHVDPSKEAEDGGQRKG